MQLSLRADPVRPIHRRLSLLCAVRCTRPVTVCTLPFCLAVPARNPPARAGMCAEIVLGEILLGSSGACGVETATLHTVWICC